MVLSLGVVTLRYYHHDIEKVSDCSFRNGICEKGSPIYLAEGRMSGASFTANNTIAAATTAIEGRSGDISIQLDAQRMTAYQRKFSLLK